MQLVSNYYRLHRRIQDAADLGFIGMVRWIRQSLRRTPAGAIPEFPPIVSVELTDHCNLSCPSCPQPQMTNERGYMTMEVFRKVVDECCRQPTFTSLVFTGYGEPLLHPQLCSMSRYAKDKGIPIVRTYTNAIALGRKRIEDLLLCSGFDEITLSLNGPTAKTYTRIKGSDDFERVVSNIKRFLRRKKELRQAKPFVNLSLLGLTDEAYDMDAFADEWRPLLGRGDRLVLKRSHDFAGQVSESGYGVLEDGGHRGVCGQLLNYLFVARAGEVSPCCVDPFKRLSIGNVLDSDLAELWKSLMLNRMRACHEAGRFNEMPLCGQCQTWRYFTPDQETPLRRIKRLWEGA